MKEKVRFFTKRFSPLMMLVLAIPLGLTFFMWQHSINSIHGVRQTKFEALTQESERALLYRMYSYNQALLGGLGFFEGSSNVDRNEWEHFVNATSPLTNLPGINGIGVIDEVKASDLETYLEQVRRDYKPDFKIHPKSAKRAYFIIKYIEPVDINREAVGLNIAFEDHRFEAANHAKKTGRTSITKRILLVQDKEKTPGFLLLLPSYDTSMPTSTQQEREAAFRRWIYAPFIAKNFMTDLTNSQGDLFHLSVYDEGVEDPQNLLFSSNKNKRKSNASYVVRKKINIMEQEWLLVWSSTSKFTALENNNEPAFILIIGILLTGLTAVLLITFKIEQSESKLTTYQKLIPVIAFFITASGGYFLKERIAKSERSFIQSYINETTRNKAETIREAVTSKVLALSRMADRWSIRGGTPFNEWQDDAKNYVADQPGLKAVEWVDKNYRVKWVEPLKGNEGIIGLDVLFDEKRKRALENIEKKKSVTLTPPLDLVQGYKAFIAYSPISVKGKHQGFIAGLFSIEELLADLDDSNYLYSLSHDGNVFYRSSDSAIGNNIQFQSTLPLKLYDREWELHLTATDEFITAEKTFLPNLVFVTSLALALLVAWVIRSAQHSRVKTLLIAEKEELLSMFVRYTPAAVAMLDKNMNYLAASERWYKDYGIGRRNIIGKNHYDIFPEITRNHPEWLEMHKKALAGEIIHSNEELFQRDNGQDFWLRYELRPWQTSNDKIGGIIMFTEDITERKRMDVLKDDFISTLSHELRTPTTSIRTALELLEIKMKGNLNEQTERFLRLAHTNCVQLADLVDDILDVQKIASGKMSYNIEKVEMVGFVQEVVEQHQFYAEKHHVSFKVTAKVKEAYCEIDRGRFNQALANLLSNAAKFSPKGKAVIITVAKKGRKALVISVEDKGPGIPKSFQDKVFDKFLQADSSATREKGGTGLGLNITKSIIEAFCGNVTFKTKENKGTTFFFELPTTPKK